MLDEMLKNQDIDELLEAYLDDELSPEEHLQVSRHLEQDPEAAAKLAMARRIQQGLRSLPKQTCPKPLTERVIAYAESDEEARRNAWTVKFQERWRRVWRPLADLGSGPAWLGGAVAAALTLVMAVAVHQQGPNSWSHPASWTSDSVAHSTSLSTTPETTVDPSPGIDSLPEGLSPQEVAAAEQEVKLALAYLGKLGRTAGGSVKQLSLRTVSGE